MVTSQPVLLKSITALSRYEAASGSFQVVVDLSQHSLLPSFLQGSETQVVGQQPGTRLGQARRTRARLAARCCTSRARKSLAISSSASPR
jgi:hypothetical protein